MDEIQKHYAKCLQWVYFVLCKLYLNKTLKKSLRFERKKKRKSMAGAPVIPRGTHALNSFIIKDKLKISDLCIQLNKLGNNKIR